MLDEKPVSTCSNTNSVNTEDLFETPAVAKQLPKKVDDAKKI
jgi:hypothetical protein